MQREGETIKFNPTSLLVPPGDLSCSQVKPPGPSLGNSDVYPLGLEGKWWGGVKG